ncbi:MAG: hypothetical protein K2K57_11535 [Oscillospiraceae bacterium]|nr:hypothetical protein [Oscillospiraceae bacterium]
MTALIVIGVLILLLVLLVNIPVTAHIKFYGGRLDIAVKYFGIGILPRGKKKKRSKKRKRSKLPSPKRFPLEEDEEIFEDIAEIGFADSTNAGSASESGFDEDDSEEGYAENRGNEQENISEGEFAAGGYQTENPGEKNAEISMNSPEDDSGNYEENSEEKSENYPRKSEKI